MTEQTQTVVDEADTEQKPAAAEVVDDAQKDQEFDLDSLLKEWDEGTEEQKAPTEIEEKSQLAEIMDYVKSQKTFHEVQSQKMEREEYKKIVGNIKGDLPVSEKYIDGYLQVRAMEDSRIRTAYVNRERNPVKWEKIQKALQAEIYKDFSSLPDKSSTDARKQIASAIKGAQSTTQTQQNVSLGSMSNEDFNKELDAYVNS